MTGTEIMSNVRAALSTLGSGGGLGSVMSAATPSNEVPWSETPNRFSFGFNDGTAYAVIDGKAVKIDRQSYGLSESVSQGDIQRVRVLLMDYTHMVERLNRWIEIADLQIAVAEAEKKIAYENESLAKQGSAGTRP